MTEVKIDSTGAYIIPPADALTTATTNAEVHFVYDETWAAYEGKRAVFSNELQTVEAEISGDDVAKIPPVILATLWRFVSVSVAAEGAGAFSPFVRIGQVLPSGKPGEGGQFVTFEQLLQILADYVKQNDLEGYVTDEMLQAALAEYIRASEAAEEYATKQELRDGLSGKADNAALSALATTVAGNTAAIAGKAEQSALQALSENVASNTAAIAGKADTSALADYWSKADIALQTSGAGNKFLADDGEYKAVQGGGGGVTPEDLAAALADYLQKTDAAEIYATKAALDGKADTAALSALSATVSENSAAITRKADSDDVTALAATVADNTAAIATKAAESDLQALSDTVTGNTAAIAQKADTSALAGYWSKADIALETEGTGTLFLADDGTYKPAAGDPPDLSAYLTKTEAGATYATLAALDAKADESDVTALAATVADNTAAIATKAAESDLQALSATVAGKADQTALAALSATVAENTTAIAGKADKSEIPDVTGFATNAELQSAKDDIASNTASIASNIDAIAAHDRDIAALQTATANNAAAIADNTAAIAQKAAASDVTALAATVAGKADETAIADMATQTWVQQYITSLDGTNMQF